MNEQGTVSKLDGKKATVIFARKGMCKDCGACLKAGPDEMMVEVENTLGARVGDVVAVELRQGVFIEATLVMYGLPLLALVIGLLVCRLIGASDMVTVIAALCCAVAAFAAIRIFEPKLSRSLRFRHKMTEIVSRAE